MRILYIHSADARAESYNILVEKKFPALLNEGKPEIIMVAGGDGALLHAIQDHVEEGMTFFGIAAGNENILMNKVEDLEKLLNSMSKDNFPHEAIPCKRLHVALNRNNEIIPFGYAINDVVIGGSVMGWHEFCVSHDNEHLTIQGAGICVATAIGSTGLYYNIGGTILNLDEEKVGIKGIVSKQQQETFLSYSQFQIFLSRIRGDNALFLDGIKVTKLKEDDVVTVKPEGQIFLAIQNKSDFIYHRSRFIHGK